MKNILVVDVGGTNVKVSMSEAKPSLKIPSGKSMTAALMAAAVRKAVDGWEYDAVSVGYPGIVREGRPAHEPHNLSGGWRRFDFEKAFGAPVKIVNDAAMQALGSYQGGKMLFLGLGTGLGSTLIVDGVIVPMELAHLPYRKATFEDYVGERALERDGKKKWRKHVADVVARLVAAFEPDEVVLGGGNSRNLADLPPRSRLGNNADAFPGGFRLWEQATAPKTARRKPAPSRKAKGR